jgi:DNA-binding HxlR family transcriptional regulator
MAKRAPHAAAAAAETTSDPCLPTATGETNAAKGRPTRSGCAVESALGVIGGRWKGVLLYRLLAGKKRYGDLRRFIPNCSARILTLQLRELEADGLVKRTVYPEVPPRVEYQLTPSGRTLEPLLHGLRDWGDRWEKRLPSDETLAARR